MPPARLFVVLARDAPVGVIFRRGPTHWVEVIRWDTASDTFEPGAWFRGRIYERHSDLSPSGRLLVYFCARHTRVDATYTHAWTAVSRAPWLTALALWPAGDTWNGGGFFRDETHLVLDHPRSGDSPHPDHRPPPGMLEVEITAPSGSQRPEPRPLRNGWLLEGRASQWETTWRKDLGRMLRWHESWRTAHLVERFEVVTDGDTSELPGATWADFDQQGRLVHTAAGRVYADGKELADFNDHVPNPRPSPEWARRWP